MTVIFSLYPILYKILQKLKLQWNMFVRLCNLVWNCENSECIKNSCLWKHQTIPAVYISAAFVITNCVWFAVLAESV